MAPMPRRAVVRGVVRPAQRARAYRTDEQRRQRDDEDCAADRPCQSRMA